MKNNIIKPLELEILELNDKAINYYNRNFKFEKIIQKESGYVVYIPKPVRDFIIETGLQYPWNNFIDGFISQYKKGLVCHPEALFFNIQKRIRPDYLLPEINFNKEKNKYFSKQKAFEYGEYLALSFCAWEFIIRDFPVYEKIFEIPITSQNEKNFEHASILEEVTETIKSIHKDGWRHAFKSKEDFILFSSALTNFFQGKEYEKPSERIKLKSKAKTKLTAAIKDLYNRFDSGKITVDKNFHKVLKDIIEDFYETNDIGKRLSSS